MCAKPVQELARDLATEMELFFYPQSVAVIGASQNPYKPNGIPLNLYYMFGYQGRLYPVNPKYETVGGLKCYPSVTDIPETVDLAIIGVAAAQAMAVLKECAAKGIKAAIVFTSGFAEVGEAGRQRQEEMQALARSEGMRILGPNCLGILNYYNGNTASFFYHQKPEGLVHPDTLSFITQSGGLGGIIHQMVLQFSIGFNYFISTGNEADLSFSDILNYLSRRDEVSLIGGYLEGLQKDGRLFIEACRQALQRRKLVTMLKVGRTASGAAAAASHTGALVGEDRVYDGLFKQFGVVRTDEVEQMNALITLYAAGRLPAGKNIGVITISGGGGVVVADKCPQYNLNVVSLTDDTQNSLREFFPSFGAVRNPVDLTSTLLTQPALFQRAIRTVMEDPRIDVGGFFYNLEMPDPAATAKIIEVYHQVEKPLVLFTWPTGQDFAVASKKELIQAGVPVIEHIPSGLWALAALAEWNEKASRQQPFPVYTLGWEYEAAAAVMRQPLNSGGRAMTESQSKRILQAYGIPVTREKLVRSAAEAVDAADCFGYPVVLKIDSPDILHKTEAGGVLLNLDSPAAVREGFTRVRENAGRYNPDARIEGVLVQEMLKPGLEVIIGMKQDPVFGPTVLFGLGGVFVEVLKDVAVRLAPLREQDAAAMLDEIKGKALLDGVRGQLPRDREALIAILLKVSRMAVELDGQIEEMDINPLFVYERGGGAIAADALLVPAGLKK
ncbi:MAG: acetate--CoA ligase family protein [Bacillota bacterium]